MKKIQYTSISLSIHNHCKLARMAADLRVTRNEVVSMLIESTLVVSKPAVAFTGEHVSSVPDVEQSENEFLRRKLDEYEKFFANQELRIAQLEKLLEEQQ